MLKKIMSAFTAIAVLASVWALSLTTAFADEGMADFPKEYKDVYDIEGELPDGWTLAEPPEDDYYYDDQAFDDYSWYEDDTYDYDWQDYDWEFEGIKGMDMEMDMEMKNWSDEEYEIYWDGYEWEENAWDDQAYGYYDLYQEVDELIWLLNEIDIIYEQYAAEGVDMPTDINDGLTAISEEANNILNHEKLAPLYDLARDGIEGGGDYEPLEKDHLDDLWNADYSGDLDLLLQTIGEFWSQEPWGLVDYAWDNLYGYYSAVDVRSEIEWMLEDLSIVATFVEALVSLEINDFRVKWAVDNLEALIPEAQSTLEEMLALADQNQVEMDVYWGILDDIGMIFYDNMEAINEYFDEHPDALEELYGLVPAEDIDVIVFWLEEPLMEPEYDFEGDFDKYYGGIEYEYEDGKDFETVFADTFEEDLYDEIIRSINARLMEELVPYFEDMISKAIIGNIMSYMDVLGEEIANGFLENQSAILEKLDFDISNAGGLKDELKALHERVKSTVVPDNFRVELEKALENLKSRVALGAADDELSAAIDAVRVVLDKIDYENIFGENPVEFYDVPFDEELVWYWDDVTVARNEGIISGYTDEKGDLTGYFGPSNNVTYAEALKMLMEAGGFNPIPPDYGHENEPWYEGYVRTFHNLGFEVGFERVDKSEPADWNAPAPRGDILVMANTILGIAPVDYVEGTFPDIEADDKLADDAMASYLAGIFTGHSETGKLKPGDYIDRASFAKVINTALEYLGQINFVDELGKFKSTLVE